MHDEPTLFDHALNEEPWVPGTALLEEECAALLRALAAWQPRALTPDEIGQLNHLAATATTFIRAIVDLVHGKAATRFVGETDSIVTPAPTSDSRNPMAEAARLHQPHAREDTEQPSQSQRHVPTELPTMSAANPPEAPLDSSGP